VLRSRARTANETVGRQVRRLGIIDESSILLLVGGVHQGGGLSSGDGDRITSPLPSEDGGIRDL
jgi:hypothetical protein